MVNDSDDHLHSISKSQRKREMHELQALGERLVNLSPEKLATFDLPEKLYEAIIDAQHFHQRGAHKRQLQYIGRLMRDVDPEPIQDRLADIAGQSATSVRRLHTIEHWRDHLIADGDTAIADLVKDHPTADRQYLRQLIRNARRETHENQSPKSARTLFKYLRDLINDADAIEEP